MLATQEHVREEGDSCSHPAACVSYFQKQKIMKGFPPDEKLKDVLASMIRSLVKQPERIGVREFQERNISVFEVKMDHLESCDAGRVMGKDGRTAEAIRQVLRAAAGVRHRHCQLRFLQKQPSSPAAPGPSKVTS